MSSSCDDNHSVIIVYLCEYIYKDIFIKQAQ